MRTVDRPKASRHGCYTVADLVAILKISRRAFYKLWKNGELPFLEELKPRIGRRARFRADLVDRWLPLWKRPTQRTRRRRSGGTPDGPENAFERVPDDERL
jgi:excisionase family DNA binding protein